ncbi:MULTISPECIES: hypothetical protein [unclassified Paenibacillus]|uniref:hypothetical protein n=1 Tax=unclassified Paenibacillus TaxID=185978 RepID=UPI0030F98823
MRNNVVIVDITPIGHNRIVTLANTQTGQRRTLLYGDSVTERSIRWRAPSLWKTARPIKA